MSTQTIRELAAELHKPVTELLSQLKDAGVEAKDEQSAISPSEKMALLAHLQKMARGSGTLATSGAGRITLKRTEKTELKLGGGRGLPSKTVNIEVKKRRTYVAQDELPTATRAPEDLPEISPEEAQAAEEAALRQQADREAAAARAAAEAEARRVQEEAKRKEREEVEAKQRAEAEAAERARTEHAEKLKNDPIYRAKWEAESSRRRAQENLARAAEAARIARTAPPPVAARPAAAAARPAPAGARPAPGAARPAPAGAPAPAKKGSDRDRDRGRREELHLADGKGGRRDRKGGKKPSGAMRMGDNAHAFERPLAPIVREVEVPEAITVAELASRMAVKAGDLIKVMMRNGVMATINQTLDQDTAVLMVEEMGHTAKAIKDTDFEDSLEQAVTGEGSDVETITRPPVVTIMGHVDHGKTSLLDHIRKTRVAAGEAGGITQHIGAYHVETKKGVISFLDTPGHAAFTRMRARGAQITDVVILVVAGDDGVMPQTREAIQHARAAKAPMVVAVTKIDKPQSDLIRVKNELLKEEVVAEDFGGDTMVIGVSSHTGQGIDELLDAVLLQAEVLELRAQVDALARGVIIESSVEKGRGPVATVLVRSGTLKQGDVILTGPHFGRVRAMFDENGKPVKSAGPSIPVQVLGLSGAPDAGDDVVVVADERKARELAIVRENKMRETKLAQSSAVRMENAFANMGDGEKKALNLMVKADVQGSAEAITEALRKLPSEEVRVNVLSTGIGGISESDVELALASKAIIIAFNVRADAQARKRVQDTGVDLRYYSIIYNILDDVTAAITGLLGTETREQIVGIAQVRDVFRSSKIGAIAGCLVMDGSVQKNLPIRVLRNNTVIYEGVLESLRRFKDDVAKVEAGTECGIGVKDYNDVKVGDQIECFQRVEVQRVVKA
ncbi:translation initiation factor IF-2 [Stagnimonas aquatica]|uniref:Translation initiation factor IF-2 n=1 Tax=Stagnimonas aquatica TaxID=2689987 RepID=A0A3N0VDR5_9GAMM|nr:translation initiation factor IF-2 [Stagnimonas aquatica]ROH90899.1 translation initiation factor IF-2 [Stagnimonas aquatica]